MATSMQAVRKGYQPNDKSYGLIATNVTRLVHWWHKRKFLFDLLGTKMPRKHPFKA